MSVPVVSATAQVLAHVPGLVRHGSKPQREVDRTADLERAIAAALRSFDEAVAYAPHQAFIGAMHPRDLPERPWAGTRVEGAERFGPFGEVMPETEFMGLLAAADEFGLVSLEHTVAEAAIESLAKHPLAKGFDLDAIDAASSRNADGGLSLAAVDGSPTGSVAPGHDADDALSAEVMLENLAIKASGSLALLHLIELSGIDPLSIDYVIGFGEEAVGDRYQRGGGNMAKAIARSCGLSNASGADVKNFCAAPLPALVVAGSLVSAGVFRRVAVVAGGSLGKLGMKFQGHLAHGMPILEDVMAGSAAIVEPDDGTSPQLRLDSVGRHTVSAGGAAPQIMSALAIEPLDRLGLSTTDIDDYATELHDPEVTEPQGSGDVPARNYRTIAALAARRGDIAREDIDGFVATRGMPGFAPTQGHIASAICYLPHALERFRRGEAERVMLLAKGSLFLGRMCELSDGMSVLLARNPKGG